ncbi:preprotein translocase subunit SecA [Paenibacillus konkukensis]|uniref:Preprotein translocase subunit SecA n=1 Tax=Paenibacillus konkukensis TaxID=2020716 RepID=A0ABY4RDJ9_9BACL|nr:hypothetical protein [Paenibacillus konkukensis]UQZ80856.1 preprotein translocase subunit SecA [Paenibacillus konkukensis]
MRAWVRQTAGLKKEKIDDHLDRIHEQQLRLKIVNDRGLSQLVTGLRAVLPDSRAVLENKYVLFASIQEAMRRVWQTELQEQQLAAGWMLSLGYCAELPAGMNRALTATLPASWYSLLNCGVHVMSESECAAKRDYAQASPVYELLGLTAGLNGKELSPADKKNAYRQSMTYGDWRQFGLDYLRDHLSLTLLGRVQRPPAFAIIHEADAVLLDEALTPVTVTEASPEESPSAIRAEMTAYQYITQYKKATGLTGPLGEGTEEISGWYKLSCVAIPSESGCRMEEDPERIFVTAQEKRSALVEEVAGRHASGQPVLIGIATLSEAVLLAERLREAELPFAALYPSGAADNAAWLKTAVREGAITLAASEAVGGIAAAPEEEADAPAGGLFVIAAEMHASARTLQRLKSCSGGPDTPGRFCKFLSLEDALIEERAEEEREMYKQSRKPIRKAEKEIRQLFDRLHASLHHASGRSRSRQIWFDEVVREQMQTVYSVRDELWLKERVLPLLDRYVQFGISEMKRLGSHSVQKDLEHLRKLVERSGSPTPEDRRGALHGVPGLLQIWGDIWHAVTADPAAAERLPLWRQTYMDMLDRYWAEHLDQMKDVRWSVEQHVYGKEDPAAVFQHAAYTLFQQMETARRKCFITWLLREELPSFLLSAKSEEPVPALERSRR